jgi:ParB family chromosome partitioning protein
MSSKADIFAELDLGSDFSTRPMTNNGAGDDPREIGKRRLRNAAQIELGRIISKDQVRTDFDPDKHQELVASLKAHGQQQPARVYWSEQDGRFVILQGERRFRAAQEAGITHLDCVILDHAPSEAERIELQLIENIIRQELNPVEEAQAFKALMDSRQCTAKDIALEIGRDPTTIQRCVRLLELPADILADVAAGLLPKSLIREVQKLKTEEEQRQMIANYKSGETFGSVTQKVKATTSGKTVTAKTKKVHTSSGIKVEATAKRKVTNAEIISVLEEWLEELKNDGRGKKAA